MRAKQKISVSFACRLLNHFVFGSKLNIAESPFENKQASVVIVEEIPPSTDFELKWIKLADRIICENVGCAATPATI